MAAKKSFYLLDPLQAVPDPDPKSWLGRVVLDYRRPTVGYTPREAILPTIKFHSDPELLDVSRVIDNISSHSLQLSFLDAVGVSVDDFRSRTNSFSSRKVERLRVHHDADVLDAIINTPAVVADLGEWGLGPFQAMYLVVGLLVAEDVLYESAEADKISFGANVDPATLASIATTGVPLPVSSNIAGGFGNETGAKAATRATGTRIFALEYRSFRRRLVQRADNKVRMKAYGPQGERAFESSEIANGGLDVHIDLDPEPFGELVEADAGAERCFEIISDTND